jgi:hypothetical protein
MGEPLVSSWFLLAETTFQLRIPNSSFYTQVSILPDAEFASMLSQPQTNFTHPPELIIDMEDGTQQAITLTNHPLNRMYDYLTEHYGKKFGVIYWGALTSVGKPQQFYGFLGYLKKDPQFL